MGNIWYFGMLLLIMNLEMNFTGTPIMKLILGRLLRSLIDMYYCGYCSLGIL